MPLEKTAGGLLGIGGEREIVQSYLVVIELASAGDEIFENYSEESLSKRIPMVGGVVYLRPKRLGT